MSVSRGRVERAAKAAAARSAAPPTGSTRAPLVVPNIADFVLAPEYLGITSIWPRQLLVLKLIMAQPELLTDYDFAVLDQWRAGFGVTEDGSRFEGTYGTTPDVLERIETLRAAGRRYFREAVMVLGRRAGKNWIGAILGAYLIWRLLCTEDPQAHFHIDRAKALSIPVFAGQRAQARSGQWQDLVDRVTSAPCFEPYIAEQKAGTLRLWTPAQLDAGARDANARGLLEVVAKEATPLAGRGPAAAGMFFDEMAHMVNAGANRNAEEIFTAAVPSLRQCQPEAFIYQSSTPWSQQGQFYENYCRGLELDENCDAAQADTIVFQLPSWDLFEDWERTHDGLEAYPGGPLLPRLENALVEYDDAMRDDEKRNPQWCAVEYWAQWRTSPDAYLARDQVLRIFEPYDGRVYVQQTRGTLDRRYVAHVDPSKSQANTALTVIHGEDYDSEVHAIVDQSRLWRPVDFPGGIVDPRVVVAYLKELLLAFPIAVLTFDQFNSIGSILELREFVAQAKLPVRTQIIERTATAAGNWRQAEQFKTMIGQGRFHAPADDQAQAELLALVEKNGRVSHPGAGPVQTDDLADCYFNALDSLVGPDYGHLFAQVHPRLSQPNGSPFPRNPDIDKQFAGSRRARQVGHGAPRAGSGGAARGARFR